MFGVCRLRHLVLHSTEHAFSEPWPAWTRLSVPPRTHSNGNTHLVVDEPLDRLRLALLGEEHLDVLIAQAFAGLELVPAAADHSLYVLHALQTEHASERVKLRSKQVEARIPRGLRTCGSTENLVRRCGAAVPGVPDVWLASVQVRPVALS